MLGLGFVLSFITLVLLATIYGAFLAFFTYIVSILLRGIGWISLSKAVNKRFFVGVGFSVIVCGLLFIESLIRIDIIMLATGLPENIIILGIFSFWIIYSIIEWFGYLVIAKTWKSLFCGSMVSLIGISVLLITLLCGITIQYGINMVIICPLRYYIILLPLIVSSLISAIGFLTWNIEEAKLSITQIIK